MSKHTFNETDNPNSIEMISNERVITLQNGEEIFIRRASNKDSSRTAALTNLFFYNSHLSKLHASLRLYDDYFYLKDCNSTFGTIINEEFIVPGSWFRLSDDDTIGFIISKPSHTIETVVGKFVNQNTIPLNQFLNAEVALRFKTQTSENKITFIPLNEGHKQDQKNDILETGSIQNKNNKTKGESFDEVKDYDDYDDAGSPYVHGCSELAAPVQYYELVEGQDSKEEEEEGAKALSDSEDKESEENSNSKNYDDSTINDEADVNYDMQYDNGSLDVENVTEDEAVSGLKDESQDEVACSHSGEGVYEAEEYTDDDSEYEHNSKIYRVRDIYELLTDSDNEDEEEDVDEEKSDELTSNIRKSASADSDSVRFNQQFDQTGLNGFTSDKASIEDDDDDGTVKESIYEDQENYSLNGTTESDLNSISSSSSSLSESESESESTSSSESESESESEDESEDEDQDEVKDSLSEFERCNNSTDDEDSELFNYILTRTIPRCYEKEDIDFNATYVKGDSDKLNDVDDVDRIENNVQEINENEFSENENRVPDFESDYTCNEDSDEKDTVRSTVAGENIVWDEVSDSKTCSHSKKRTIDQIYCEEEKEEERITYSVKESLENIEPDQKKVKTSDSSKFKKFFKEVGKGACYALATITALGIYGSTIAPNE